MSKIEETGEVRVVIIYEYEGLDVARIPDDLNVFERIIGCDCVDMPRRYIGDREYRIICDDEGMLKNRLPTCLHIRIETSMLVGTVIFTAFTEDGERLRSLTNAEIETIKAHYDEDRRVVTDLSYLPTKIGNIPLWKWDRAFNTDPTAAKYVYECARYGAITTKVAEESLDEILGRGL